MPGHLGESPLPGMPEPDRARPKWSAAQAARECGVGRATIQRALDSGRIHGAERDESGTWMIPVNALIQAGFVPGKQTPPDVAATTGEHLPVPLTRQDDRAGDEQVLALSKEVERLRGALDVEHARAAAAEQLAAERAGRVEDLRLALRILEAGSTDTHDAVAIALSSIAAAEQLTVAPEAPRAAGRLRTWLRGR